MTRTIQGEAVHPLANKQQSVCNDCYLHWVFFPSPPLTIVGHSAGGQISLSFTAQKIYFFVRAGKHAQNEEQFKQITTGTNTTRPSKHCNFLLWPLTFFQNREKLSENVSKVRLNH